MKAAVAAALVRDDVTTVSVVHVNGGVERDQEYDYKILRRFAEGITKGDYLIAKNARGFVIVKVCEVHPEPQIDLDSNINYRWVFQKVNTLEIQCLEKEDEELIKQIQQVQRRRVKQSVLNELCLEQSEVQDALQRVRYQRTAS